MDIQDLKQKKSRMNVKETYVPSPIPDALDFPKFFKNGSRFTKVESKSKFTEVQLMKTSTVIRTVSNLHMVDDAMKKDTPSDQSAFNSALTEAMERIMNQQS